MRCDWKKHNLSSEWLDNMGIYGDLPRRMFITPIVLNLISHLVTENKDLLHVQEKGIIKYTSILLSDNYTPKMLEEYSSLKALNCLDLGCGEGYLNRHLINLRLNYIGIDSNYAFIKKAKQLKQSRSDKYLIIDLNKFGTDRVQQSIIALANKRFDPCGALIVFCHILIEHLDNPVQFLKTLRKMLTRNFPKAIVSFIILNEEFFSRNVITKKKSSFSIVKYKGELIIPDTSAKVTVNFLSIDRFVSYLTRIGFEIIDLLNFDNSLYPKHIWKKFLQTDIGPFSALILH